ncbi:DNA polymerase III subunit gamma/tau [Thiovibrio frasassiensis]|uniref:DNA polymerase III subunit gamma/tau n=1 Tax=Thiovibrio frasassiensis TaxID=2984131 RepID=A0A9X4MNS4_9BACT|nr:DNA polymerase III subunit gamma/tau [Thiovibrio frasassiensis]MDG4476057.1 DNA polymerase III subunit gamma/tau [Thiovibrio frasassiensis]
MSYLVLARKWRPQNFDEVVGQQAVVRTLRNALTRNRVAHAMLFSGVRGVGKTTLARLMAKALNCQQGEPDVPCDQCESCTEIMAGNAIDLHEIDGASNRGIQEIRELKENIRFFPAKGRYKIIIIDEVHMLTTEAFNALLKTLEEPPAHVYFMFATTELHKIPITILSRCQRYELKRVPFAELVAFFAKIAEAEKVAISARALEMIAREAEGSVRDGLSLLDQIFSFGGSEVSDGDVAQVLGLVDRGIYENLARALLVGDLAGCLEIFAQSQAAGMDLKRFANDLLGFFRGLLIAKVKANPEELLDLSDQELAAIKDIAAGASQETLYHYFSLLLKGTEEMQYSSRPRLALEMAFVRATQAGQIVPTATLLGRLDGLLAGAVSLPVRAAGGIAPAISTAEPEPVAPRPASRPSGAAPSSGLQPEQKKNEIADTPTSSPGQFGHSSPVAASPPVREVKRDWEAFVGYVKERKRWMAPVLQLCAMARDEGNELVLKFDDPSDCKLLQEHDNLKLLQSFALDFFQHDFRVVFKVRGAPAAEDGGGDEAESLLAERRVLANEPMVQMAAEIFGGQVGSIRTGPR